MLVFIARRTVSGLITLLVVLTTVFLAIRIVPGDPAIAALGSFANEATLESFRETMGINEPLWNQYTAFVGGLLVGDWGRSVISRQPISGIFRQAIPYSLELALAGTVIGLIIALPVGILAAVKRNTWMDYLSRILSLGGLSVPAFVLGIMLILVFSIWLGWFPVAGQGEAKGIGERLYRLALPALNIGLITAAYNARMVRAAVLEVLGQDYVRTARSKGLPEGTVLLGHVLRNAWIPIITIVGLNVGMLIASSVMTEIVFNRPGLGRFVLSAMGNRDYTLIQALVVVIAAFVVFVNLITDLLYGFIDPRVQYQ